MYTLSDVLNILLPSIAALLLFVGLKLDRINYLITALWLSLIALVLQYQTAGSELLGNYFGYKNAAIYTVNLLVLITILFALFYKHPLFQRSSLRYLPTIISSCMVLGTLVLFINVWVNAVFIENKRIDTPLMQVAMLKPLPYCAHRYIFYKINNHGKLRYMCPNHYGFIPSVGTLDVTPDFIVGHLGQINRDVQHQ